MLQVLRVWAEREIRGEWKEKTIAGLVVLEEGKREKGRPERKNPLTRTGARKRGSTSQLFSSRRRLHDRGR
jgi:hypothetical protein